jgi:hypothetical protein
MLSVEECKRILNRNSKKYSDEDAEKIRDFLWELAQIEVRNFEAINENENGSYNEQGEQ